MPMPEKKTKKVTFTEEDAATLIERYDAITVLTLLQEVANYPHAKIDWKEMVKKTSTAISNAREYQMLWRHLAYRDSLPKNLEEGAEPLDDDSDLDCELEALPPVSAESATEAAACVKVMIASSGRSETTPTSSTIEAPLTVSVPVSHSSRTLNGSSQSSNSMQGTNVIFPVTVPRQTLPTALSTDGVENKRLAGGNMASKRKRKAWSEEEDVQLRAAVLKWGEGNWATMAKRDNFPIKRSPTQLAQRWSILRKKDGSTSSGTILTSTAYTTAEQLATRHSLSLALDMPFKKLTAPGMTDPARTSFNTSSKNQVQQCNTTEASTVHNSGPPQHASQQSLSGSCVSPSKSKLAPEKPVPKVISTPNPAVKTIAVAAGARIVSQSDAASQLKVAQVRNAVPTSSSLTKSSTPAGLPSESKVQLCTGSSAAPVPSHSTVAISSPASCIGTVKVASPIEENLPAAHVTSVVNQVTMKQEVKQEVNTTEEFRVSDPSPMPRERVQEDEKLDLKKSMNLSVKEGETHVMENKSEVSTDRAVLQNPTKCEDQWTAKNSNLTLNMDTTKNHQIAADSNLNKGSQDLDQDKSANLINGSSEDQNMNEKQANL